MRAFPAWLAILFLSAGILGCGSGGVDDDADDAGAASSGILSYVSDDFLVAIHIRPQVASKSDLFSRLPLDEISEEGADEMGFDFRHVTDALVQLGAPSGTANTDRPPQPRLLMVLKFSRAGRSRKDHRRSASPMGGRRIGEKAAGVRRARRPEVSETAATASTVCLRFRRPEDGHHCRGGRRHEVGAGAERRKRTGPASGETRRRPRPGGRGACRHAQAARGVQGHGPDFMPGKYSFPEPTGADGAGGLDGDFRMPEPTYTQTPLPPIAKQIIDTLREGRATVDFSRRDAGSRGGRDRRRSDGKRLPYHAQRTACLSKRTSLFFRAGDCPGDRCRGGAHAR